MNDDIQYGTNLLPFDRLYLCAILINKHTGWKNIELSYMKWITSNY